MQLQTELRGHLSQSEKSLNFHNYLQILKPLEFLEKMLVRFFSVVLVEEN